MPPIPGNQDTIWMYPTVETTEDKRATRLAVVPPKSYEVIGADGLTEGGLRLFPGFKSVHKFGGSTAWNTAIGGSNHDETSKIIDVFPINFAVGSDGYGYGFVYRVRRKASGSPLAVSTSADILIDYYETKTTTLANRWHRNKVIATNVSATKQMSVSVFGKHIYVFVEDADVKTFSTDPTNNYNPTTVVLPGPGLQPMLLSPSDPGNIGALNDVSRGSLPGYGKIFLTNQGPTDIFGAWDRIQKQDGTYISPGGLTTYTYPDKFEDATTTINYGDYAYGYILFNSQNGRRSALSKVADAVEADYPTAGGNRINAFVMLELVYDSSKYDQCYIYRSVRVQSAGGTYIASIMHLERIITLADYVDRYNSVPMPNNTKHVTYWFTLTDRQLVYQDVFMDRALFDEKMPKGGVSLMYEGTMLVGNINSQQDSWASENRANDAFTGLGEFRWSSLTDLSPELFPPGNSYVPSLRSNEIIAVRQAGPNCIAFSRDRQYHIRKEANYIKVQEMHEGFGVVNPKALDTVGSLIYFVTTKGIKAVDTQGALDDVRSLNSLILDDWSSTLDSVSVAFDPTLSALFIHNESKQHTACFWFTTASVTELVDTTFSQVVRGIWPQNFTLTNDSNPQYANPLLERCFWLKNNYLFNETSASNASPEWELMTVDYQRDNAGLTLLPLDVGANTTATVYSNGVFYLDTGGGQTIPSNVNGRYAYVLSSTDRSNIGRKVLMKEIGAVAPGSFTEIRTFEDVPGTFAFSLKTGDVIGLSPVYFRWVGGPVMPQAEDGTMVGAQDWFRVKHIKSITPHFTGVSGPTITAYPDACRYRGLVYRGNSDTPTVAETVNQNDQLVASILEDRPIWSAAFGTNLSTSSGKYGIDGATLAPGVEIFCPDLDFMMCGVMVSGSMRSTFRAGPLP
jgi:hypothetical protein